ncbi:MAG: hypothetical protein AAB426_05720 [Myxococcota bacterium]
MMRSPTLVALLVVLLGSGCAASRGGKNQGHPLGATSDKAAPGAWQDVRLVVVDVARGDTTAFGVAPHEALGNALLRRLGGDGARPVTLEVGNVKVAQRTEPMSVTLGLAADFRLVSTTGEKTVRLEHSINVMHGALGSMNDGYARLVDDLCDQLFYNQDALAFLSQPGATQVEDSALVAGADDLGPVTDTAPSTDGAQATGRILWGNRETASNGVAAFMLGDTKMMMASLVNRSASLRYGVGQRSGAGIAIMPGTTSSTTVAGRTVDTSQPTFVGVLFQVGLELGYLGVHRSPEGYVLAPGWSLLVVPQGQGFLMMGNQNDQSITMNMVTIGAALELDVPIGASLGIKGTLFGGATATSVTAGDYTYKSGFSRITNPSFDIYMQSATGRMSLGLGLSTLASAATDSDSREALTKNPMLIFTWEDWVGRGMAYAKQDVEMLGISVHDNAEVLSMPRSAFVGEGHPSAGGGAPATEPQSPVPFRPVAAQPETSFMR